MQSRKRRRNIEPDVHEYILEQAERGITATKIEIAAEALFPGRVPSRRTIQNVVHDVTQLVGGGEDSKPWSPLDAEPDASLVLDVLAAVIAESDGLRTELTRAEAVTIAAVRRAAPTIPLWTAYAVAREYVRRRVDELGAGDLDAFLAFQPWTDINEAMRDADEENRRESFSRFVDALDRGLVPMPRGVGVEKVKSLTRTLRPDGSVALLDAVSESGTKPSGVDSSAD